LLVGYNYGGIYNCSASGSVSNSYPKCGGICGGLVGVNGSIINSSYANVDTHGYGTDTKNTDVGGLVGDNVGNSILANSYATGNVTGHIAYGSSIATVGGLVGAGSLAIFHCYSTGHELVTGNIKSSQRVIGGLIATVYGSGNIDDSFWDVNTSGLSTSAAGTGLTTVQMKTYSTFVSAGWDFTNESVNDTNDIWRMCTSGVDYPRLNWESMAGDFACPDGVSFVDFAYFAAHWSTAGCSSSNNFCGGADMNHSGTVDMLDFVKFAENWLLGI
jgi:hypothetical protein